MIVNLNNKVTAFTHISMHHLALIIILPAVFYSRAIWAQEYFYITHKPTGAKMHSCALVDGSIVKTAPSQNNETCAQWEKVNAGEYFYIKNRASGKHVRPDTIDDGSPMVMQPSSWTGNWTQWQLDDRGDGFGHLVNRATGKHIHFANSNVDRMILQQPSSWQGNYTRWQFTPVPQDEPFEQDKVVITESFVTWDTYDYELNSDFSISSFNHDRVIQQTFSTWIIENRFLKVTVLPDFGGRILSLVNKITGSETLYQNPVGTPYLIGRGIFYYDWLMVYGGIFPTFPEAEHGKSWNRIWDFNIVNNSEEEITISMSYADKDAYARAPFRYMRGFTNLEATYFVTLKAGRAALDTEIVLRNPTDTNVRYEYWTNTALAPGSQEGNPRATDGFEIIAPIDRVFIDYGVGVSRWEDVQWFINHEEGIAYAEPNMQGGNFWGAINHDVEEGIFRIADNTLTPGLKIFTFGYDSVFVDPFADGSEWHRPTVELWAGETNRFFQKKNFPANSSHSIPASYSPSAGLTNVTHANDKILVNISEQNLGLYFMNPNQYYQVTVSQNDNILYSARVRPDLINGNIIPGDFSQNSTVEVTDDSGETIFTATN